MTAFVIQLTDRCGVCRFPEPLANLAVCWYRNAAGEVAWIRLVCPICRQEIADVLTDAGRGEGWNDGSAQAA